MIAFVIISAFLASQDEGLLRDRLPPVAGNVATKAGRVELFPSVGFSVRDSFFKKTAPTLGLSYHFTDVLGLTARGSYNFVTEAASMQVCAVDGSGCRTLNRDELGGRAPGHIVFTAGAEVELSPLYGKLAVLSEGFFNADLYLTLGGHLVGYIGSGNALKPTIGGAVGLGLRLFFTRWLALRLEFRDLLYPEAVILGEKDTTLIRNQLYAHVGLSFILPSFASKEGKQ